MVTPSRIDRVTRALTITGLVASGGFLAFVYAYTERNLSVADAEEQRLAVEGMIIGLLIATPAVAATMLALDRPIALVAALVAGGCGAAIAVMGAAASTIAIAWAIEPWTDPGDGGRVLFPVAYTGALVLALIAGIATASVSVRRDGLTAIIGILLACALTIGAWGYLAVASSELNQCVVDDEFPLATDHVCSGY